jgi:hypothetical protein
LNNPHTSGYVEFSFENMKGKSHMGESGDEEMILTQPLQIPPTEGAKC